MVFKDRPETENLVLPPDNLSGHERLSRLFSGIEKRWRLLAVLTLNSVPSNLMKPELVQLARRYGPCGLAVRLVFIGDDNISMLEKELSLWCDEHIVATGDNIHARRCLDTDKDFLPCLKLYSPEGELRIQLSGFDTEQGLDPICRILADDTNVDCEISEDRTERAAKAANQV